jgi:hypothetical protein
LSTLICDFMGDSSLEETANRLCKLKPKQFTHLFSHRLPKAHSSLSKLEFIDATCLYTQNNLPLAFPDLQISPISFRNTTQYSECISIFLISMDRTLPISISVHDQIKYFWDLVGYFISFFNSNEGIDSILYDNTPHLPWDICLFYVAKELNLKTFIVRKTGIRGFLYIDEDFRSGKTNWEFEYKNLSNPLKLVVAKKNFVKELRDLSFSKGQVNGMWSFNADNINGSLLSKIKNHKSLKKVKNLYSLLQVLLRSVPNNNPGATESSGQNTTLSGLKHVSRTVYFKLYSKFIKHIEDNKNSYTSYAVSPNLEQSYIYFPLHLQPERTTMPEGMYFDNQILAIRMLSVSLPDGWRIIVKEHPRQMHYDIRSLHARSTNDYDSINRLENVIIVPIEQSQDVLVKSCKLTATISGSVSWEGLLVGKPSLLFSENWHTNCASTAFVCSVEEVKEAISHLAKKNIEQVENDVSSFVKDSHIYLINAALNKNHLKMFFNENNKSNSSHNLSSAIIQRLEI